MRRLLYRLPIVRGLLRRRQLAALGRTKAIWRREAAEHNAAVTRILAGAPARNDRWLERL